jgi:hypothetical protein
MGLGLLEMNSFGMYWQQASGWTNQAKKVFVGT